MGDKAKPGTRTRDQAQLSPGTSPLRFIWNVPAPPGQKGPLFSVFLKPRD